MTVTEMVDRMTYTEFREWGAYFKLEAEEMRDKMAEQKALALAKKNFHR